MHAAAASAVKRKPVSQRASGGKATKAQCVRAPSPPPPPPPTAATAAGEQSRDAWEQKRLQRWGTTPALPLFTALLRLQCVRPVDFEAKDSFVCGVMVGGLFAVGGSAQRAPFFGGADWTRHLQTQFWKAGLRLRCTSGRLHRNRRSAQEHRDKEKAYKDALESYISKLVVERDSLRSVASPY